MTLPGTEMLLDSLEQLCCLMEQSEILCKHIQILIIKALKCYVGCI